MADQVKNAAEQAAQAIAGTVQNVTEKVADMTTGNNAEEGAPKLYLDDVTGEMVSKSKLKQFAKQRQKEAAAAKKKAENPQPTASGRVNEAELDPTQYFENRSKAINALRTSHQPNPYACSPDSDTRTVLTDQLPAQVPRHVQGERFCQGLCASRPRRALA